MVQGQDRVKVDGLFRLILSSSLLYVKPWFRHWSHKIRLNPGPGIGDLIERGSLTGE